MKKDADVEYGFFPGCSYHGAAGYQESVAEVCRQVGIELHELPDWNCCGATTLFSLDESRALYLTGRIFALAGKSGFSEIVTVCNACYTTLRKGALQLGKDPGAKAMANEALAGEGLNLGKLPRVRHLLEILSETVPKSAWHPARTNSPDRVRVAGYYGCQLTRPWQDVGHPERPGILEDFIQTLGFDPVSHSAQTLCCGASHAMPYARECRPLILRIVSEMQAKGASVAAAICPMCQFNLDAGQKGLGREAMPVVFFTQLAGLALGIAPARLGLDKLIVSAKGVLSRLS